jgi:hypothetical protein
LHKISASLSDLATIIADALALARQTVLMIILGRNVFASSPKAP